MILREKPGKPTVHAVQRGGNWNNGANAGPLSVNLNNAPSNSNSNIGFRCTSRIRSVKSEAARLPELPAPGGSAEKLWEAHRLASYEVTDSAGSVLPAQFPAAKISQHLNIWCLQCQATASTDDLNKIFGGEAGAW